MACSSGREVDACTRFVVVGVSYGAVFIDGVFGFLARLLFLDFRVQGEGFLATRAALSSPSGPGERQDSRGGYALDGSVHRATPD
jgi:hypothetical protein